jgi:hypothetical protein
MLRWRRYPTDDAWAAVPMTRDGGELVAALPIQPPAGKVEYLVELMAGSASARIPADAEETVILRYRGAVPAIVLVPHIVLMALAMLVGVRAGAGALVGDGDHRRLTTVTLVGLAAGGLIYGPITQRYAFGAFWTGIPFGWDLTDNKTLVMWLGWAVAWVAHTRRWRAARGLVVLAAVLMLVVYVIPHSLKGSQFDYTRLTPAGPVGGSARPPRAISGLEAGPGYRPSSSRGSSRAVPATGAGTLPTRVAPIRS